MGVVQNPHARLRAEVQPAAVPLQHVHHAQALLIVLETAGVDVVERALPGMAEGRVPQIVAQGDRLRQILIQTQGARHGPREAVDLQRVGQARAVVVPLRLEENLGLVLEAAEGFRVRDAVDIPLEAGTDLTLRLGFRPAPAPLGQDPPGADDHMFKLFPFFSRTAHTDTPPFSFKIYDANSHFPLFF